MKIAYITHSFPPTGYAAAINTYKIVKGLADRKHELFVFCCSTVKKYAAQLELYDKDQPYPFNVYYSLPTPLSLSVALPHFFNAFRAFKLQYDLLMTQFHLWHLAWLPGLPLKSIKGKPWIVKVHDMIPDPTISLTVSEMRFIRLLYGGFMKACYGMFLKNFGKSADKVFVLTRELQSFLLQNGYSSDHVAVIPNGVDTTVFSPPISKCNNMDKKTILYIGSMVPEDGLDCLVKAFALLNPKKELNLTLIGDGSERLGLIELAKKLKIEQNVIFKSYIPHKSIPDIIRGAYIGIGPLFFSPVCYYTIPTKLLEYFACEKTVVSAPVSRDILRDGSTGFVVRELSPKNIAEKLSLLLEDEKLTRDMGKNARQLVVERYEGERIIDQIEKEIRGFEPSRSG